jgi:hypothetical protein
MRPFDARHAEAHPSITVRAAKPTAVSPSRVLVIVVAPGHRPIIAARSPVVASREAEFDFLDGVAWRVRTLVGSVGDGNEHRIIVHVGKHRAMSTQPTALGRSARAGLNCDVGKTQLIGLHYL